MCAFPFSVFFSAVYTESVFLLAAIGVWHHTERRSTIPAVLFGFSAGLARPNGFMLVLPLAWLLYEKRERGGDVRAACAILAAPILGMLTYSLYLGLHVGDPWGVDPRPGCMAVGTRPGEATGSRIRGRPERSILGVRPSWSATAQRWHSPRCQSEALFVASA